MYYLIVSIFTYSAAIIPDPYSSLDACNKAGSEANVASYRCIKSSQENYCKYHLVTFSIDNGKYGITKKVCEE